MYEELKGLMGNKKGGCTEICALSKSELGYSLGYVCEQIHVLKLMSNPPWQEANHWFALFLSWSRTGAGIDSAV